MRGPRPNAQFRRLLALACAAISLLGSAAPSQAADLGQVGFSLDGANLLSFDLRTPTTSTAVPITGVAAGETLVAVAVRPQTNVLYALGYNASSKSLQLYTLSERTGVATAVGATGGLVDGSGVPLLLTGDRWGMAFNPSFDRLRVVSSSGLNLRIDPNSGLFVDGNPGALGTNPDGQLSGGATGAEATAYVSPVPNAPATTQYSASSSPDALFVQSPPNAGTLTSAVPLTSGGAPLDVAAISGLAFLPGAAPAAANDPVATTAYAVVRVGAATQLATIDTATGAVTQLGALGSGGANVRGLAVRAEAAAGGLPAIALTAANQLIRFNTAAPGIQTTVSINGVDAGETLVGLARRPATGQLYALGINAAANTGTLYRLDPQGGGATFIGGAIGLIQFTDASSNTIDLSTGGYGIGFNPSADRLRVVTATGLTFRVNPNTGAAIDGDPLATGVQPDGNVNGLPGGATGLIGAAYTNAYAGTTATTLYTLESESNSLFIQNPPNLGTQTAQRTIAGLDVTAVSGFDIPADVTVASNNAAATTGTAYVVTGLGGGSTLNTVDLLTGQATSLGAVGPLVAGFSVGIPAPRAVPGPATPTPTPAGAPSSTPAPNQPPAAASAPIALRSVGVSAKSFRTGKPPRGASTKVPTGTFLLVDVDTAATLSITVERLTRGRTVRRTCVKETTRNRKAKRCTLARRVGVVTAAASTGRSRIAFAGTVGGKRLAPGDYRLRVVARGAGRADSVERTVQVRVVR